MTERIKKLISLIPKCEVFADIGCDHGYVAKGVLDNGIASNVIISDISEKCLKKAESLLHENGYDGRFISVVSNGFKNLPYCDTALIAGMGGEEIINIIKECDSLPNNLILQPMKNCDKVRLCAVNSGYKIDLDCVYFLDKKYYDVILLSKGQDILTEDEITFGRTNILEKDSAFLDRLLIQKKLLEGLLDKQLNEVDFQEKKTLLERIKKYV